MENSSTWQQMMHLGASPQQARAHGKEASLLQNRAILPCPALPRHNMALEASFPTHRNDLSPGDVGCDVAHEKRASLMQGPGLTFQPGRVLRLLPFFFLGLLLFLECFFYAGVVEFLMLSLEGRIEKLSNSHPISPRSPLSPATHQPLLSPRHGHSQTQTQTRTRCLHRSCHLRCASYSASCRSVSTTARGGEPSSRDPNPDTDLGQREPTFLASFSASSFFSSLSPSPSDFLVLSSLELSFSAYR